MPRFTPKNSLGTVPELELRRNPKLKTHTSLTEDAQNSSPGRGGTLRQNFLCNIPLPAGY